MVASGQWRYIAQRMTGDGPGEFLDFNLPLKNVDIDGILSGHEGLRGTITPEYMRLKGPDGRPILEERACAIWAEDPAGEIRGGGILTYCDFDGANWTVECSGLTFASVDLPYTDANFWIDVDPIDVFRYIWTWIQSKPNGDLGLTVDQTTSPMRIGNVMVQRVDFDTEPDPSVLSPEPIPIAPNPFSDNAAWVDKGVKVMVAVGWTGSVVREALENWLLSKYLTDKQTIIKNKVIEKIGLPPNPPGEIGRPVTGEVVGGGGEAPVVWEYEAYKLAWYKDHDLSATIDDLSAMTPFDWHLTHRWDGDQILHNIRVGYPKLGRRLDDLRFVVGENIHVIPRISNNGTEYANEILFLGSGEGSSQVRASAYRPDGRIRTVAVVSDTTVHDQRVAFVRAKQELAKRSIVQDITEITLLDHPNAPVGSVSLGDELLLEGDTGWVDLEVWVRVVATKISPDQGGAMTLTVIRSDRLP